ncbi:hypothetical protein AGLY_008978 [Aphis glycines]|uniref:Uncharacterized protein n=1 Tax=Aphis glycines TaxID=307491 RepID=A0A6G0TJU7_APHGL|nr:hypothetical protein AGLY_008978 [Aphis glycines]
MIIRFRNESNILSSRVELVQMIIIIYTLTTTNPPTRVLFIGRFGEMLNRPNKSNQFSKTSKSYKISLMYKSNTVVEKHILYGIKLLKQTRKIFLKKKKPFNLFQFVLKQTNNAAHASKANTKPNKIILLFESHPTNCTFRFFSFVSKLTATTPLSSSSNFVIWFSIVEEVMAVTIITVAYFIKPSNK